MKLLVANIGSTSFKYRLFDESSADELTELAKGSVDRIGGDLSQCIAEVGEQRREEQRTVHDHATALGLCLEQLTAGGCLASIEEVSAIGFKAVHAGEMSRVVQVDDAVLAKMDELSDVAPAHNPPYAAAMRQLRDAFPNLPLIAAFEPDFHRTIPDAHQTYAVPWEWTQQHEIRKWGFHGASHRYIATRTAELTGRDDLKIISCHLGGSSSLCAIHSCKSVFTTMGFSPQSGLPQNNRVGDFDPFALPWLMKRTGQSLESLLDTLANQSGLLGISGISGDVRDLEEAAATNPRAELAIAVFTSEIKRQLGSCLALLGGADVIVFTGGIGGNSSRVRSDVCNEMQWTGIQLDEARNQNPSGEAILSPDDSRVEIRTIPTNEELIVARQTLHFLKAEN